VAAIPGGGRRQKGRRKNHSNAECGMRRSVRFRRCVRREADRDSVGERLAGATGSVAFP